jgi:hypothetical protein
VLKWLAQGPEVFWTQTQRFQGKAKFGHRGVIWEALPAMEYLLEYLEQLKARIPHSERRLRESHPLCLREFHALGEKPESYC